MKKFNSTNEFKQIIDQRELVKIFFGDDETYYIAYILDVNEEYIAFASLNSFGNLQNIEIRLFDSVNTIETKTDLLKVMSQGVDSAVYDQALKEIADVKTFSFEGLESAFLNKNTLLQITINSNEDIVGRVVEINDIFLSLDTYSLSSKNTISRTIIHPSHITRITCASEELQILAKHLDNIGI